jgi:hypothetical protein
LARERDDVDRDDVAREPVERELAERALVERELVERDPLREERDEEAFDGLSAERTLSKSSSACLRALVASRRSPRSAAVTSL